MNTTQILLLAALIFLTNAFTYAGHTISGDASRQIAEAIKAELYFSLDLEYPTCIDLPTRPLLNS